MGAAAPDVALITGASSGIGRAIALELARRGHDLVTVARDAKALEELAAQCSRDHGRRVEVVAADLSKPEAVGAVCARLEAKGIEIGILVNNAGFGLHGAFDVTPLEDELRMVEVHVCATVRLTKALLPAMVRRGRGRVLNIGSVYSFAPVPMQAMYGATKAFLASFSEALAGELKGTGVTVTLLCPGLTRTEFHNRAGIHGKGIRGVSADVVARLGVDGMERGRLVIIPSFWNNVFVLAARCFPRRTYLALILTINRMRGLTR